MIKMKYLWLTILVNILLFPWLITQWIPGLIGWAIFRKFEIYHNEDAGVFAININKGYLFGNACFSCGPFIFTTPNCDDNTKRHETGHSVQSLWFGPLFHFVVSFPSIILFWTRRIKNKDAKWYHTHWPEGGYKFTADDLGHVDVSKYGL